MLLSNLLFLATVPATLARWGEACNGANPYTNSIDGVCVTSGDCRTPDGRATTFTAGRCLNDPREIKCCWASECINIAHNRCPGGDDVKCWTRRRECWHVATGACPGGDDYRKSVRRYFDANSRSVSC